MDFVQLEVGANSNMSMGIGGSLDVEVSVSAFLATTSLAALVSTHLNMMLTKESNSEKSFELQVEMPHPSTSASGTSRQKNGAYSTTSDAAVEQDKKGLRDYAQSWTLISSLELYVRPAKNKSEVVKNAVSFIHDNYPALEK
ncbi:hypothetical protein yc1106_06748 [Curvularia clavata]|uniref:Uncharacterized protein n=1 Tax=Curvularia clavata TaxID=95742 RepID=A0A9Q8ZDI0_CURCL|nr:hypothetical protein yc1106_06748 [Curvularia clavata]